MDKNHIEIVSDKIFGLLNLKKEIDRNDPDNNMIMSYLKKIPDNRVIDFYIYLIDRKDSFNSAGILKRSALKEAMNEFVEDMYAEIWRANDVGAKSEKLQEKLSSVYKSIIVGKYKQELKEFYKNINIKKIKHVDESGEKKPLFMEDEIEAIEYAGLENLMDKVSIYSAREIIDILENIYKIILTRKFFNGDQQNRVGQRNNSEISIKLPEPKRF